jgi:hypothetical protein
VITFRFVFIVDLSNGFCRPRADNYRAMKTAQDA